MILLWKTIYPMANRKNVLKQGEKRMGISYNICYNNSQSKGLVNKRTKLLDQDKDKYRFNSIFCNNIVYLEVFGYRLESSSIWLISQTKLKWVWRLSLHSQKYFEVKLVIIYFFLALFIEQVLLVVRIFRLKKIQ